MTPRVTPGGLRQLGPINYAIAKIGAKAIRADDMHLFSTLGRTKRLFVGWLGYSGMLMPFGALKRSESETVIVRMMCSTQARRRAGLLAAPEDRLGHAAVPEMSLTENAILTAATRQGLAKGGMIDHAAARRFAEGVIAGFDVRTPGPSTAAGALSGGNLQKFVIGREIMQEPRALIVNQPTWGVDASAAAAIRQAFDQPDRAHAGETWHKVAEQLRPRWPKLADLMDASEHDVLAYMAFPRQHRTKLHSTNPLERLNKEVKRRADVVGIFPNEASIMRLIGAVLFEQNDEWQTSSRYMMAEAFAQIDKEEIDPILSITTKAA